jgi:serine phosphatase RsbU (regulator of sigma subunit)
LNNRLAKLARIVEVKEHQRRSAEWRLGRLRQQESVVLEDQRTLIAALNEEQPLHGLFVETMAKHLGALSQRLETLRQAQARQVAELETQTGQLRQAERMLLDVTRRQSRADEWKELSEVIDAALARDDASLP